MKIRQALAHEAGAIARLCQAAFADDENQRIMDLATRLVAEPSTPRTMSLIAETGGHIVGFGAFSPVSRASEPAIGGYILAPLAVAPDRQRSGIGARLVDRGRDILRGEGVDILLVYGDPAYYGRFGFRNEAARGFVAPYPLQFPFGWQGLRLSDRELAHRPMPIVCVPALMNPQLW